MSDPGRRRKKPIVLSELVHRDDTGGLVCRSCGCRDFRVVYTRPRPGGIMRRRECRHCGKRIVTYER